MVRTVSLPSLLAILSLTSCTSDSRDLGIETSPERTQASRWSIASPHWASSLDSLVRFRFYQRLSADNQWDTGRELSPETGWALLGQLQGARPWSPDEDPQFAVAWGTHPYLPGCGVCLEVLAPGKVRVYSILDGCDFFRVDDQICVVPPEKKALLVEMLRQP
jgi:hypothetical protein